MNHLRNALWMQERGHSVFFVCVKDSRLAEEAKTLELKTIFIEKHKKYYDFKRAKQLVNLLKEKEISHLLIRSTYDMSITAMVKHKMGSSILTAYFMEMQLGVKKKNVLHTLRFKYIDLWCSPLNWLDEQVKSMTSFKNKTEIIPSGMDLSQFNTEHTSEEARTLLQLPTQGRIFGLIGRFDPQKGQLLLLEAMAKSVNKDFHIVLLGEPTIGEGEEYFNRMNATIEQFDLKERVHIRPFMKDVTTFYAATDWFVMATKAETFGMVTIESLACGTPVLGSNAGGTPEILQTNQGGLLFETMNSDDLAKQIDLICTNDITFDGAKLKDMANYYDHHKVCEMVEQALEIRD